MLELWFDFSCPYAYLASRRANRLGVPIDWRPMLLGGVFRGIGAGDGPMATLSAAKARHNLQDMHRWAEVFEVPFRMPAGHPMRTVRALRTLLGLPHSRWPDAIAAIYAAYWQRGEDVTQDAVIASSLRGAGVPDSDISAALAAADSDAIKDELRKRTDDAIALGIFGAPAWVWRDRALLVWGQDRLPWVEAINAGWAPDAGPPPGGPRHLRGLRPLDPDAPGPCEGSVEMFFDVSSPYAYLALTQLPALAKVANVALTPILLGALFKDIGQANVPLFAMPPPKTKYVGLEMNRWASWWGVPFAMPKKFPQRTVTAQRLVLLAGERRVELALALGRAMWAEGRDLEDEAELARILEASGFSRSLIPSTQEPGVKQRLADNTARAKELGVFGVPTFLVNNKHLFWGQDRLDLVARCLGGWEPRYG